MIPFGVLILRIFQPSLPVRGATGEDSMTRIDLLISTLAPREGSDQVCLLVDQIALISTLAPREGSDAPAMVCPLAIRDFNPRSP